MTSTDGNVAFKCTYHDGGQDGYVGYKGICSETNIIRNVRKKPRVWCSQPENECRRYLERGCSGKRPNTPCYESRLLDKWSFNSGIYHHGEKEGQPIPMYYAYEGKVALFSTRLPSQDDEQSRIIFAAGKIASIREKGQDGTRVLIDKSSSLPVPKEVSQRLPYWDFKIGEKRWGSGLFRYWSDEEVAKYLQVLYIHLQSPQDQLRVEHLLECVDAAPSSDERFIASELDKVPPANKYGPGGEGVRHRRLKEYIAKHPKLLGLGEVKDVRVEHSFITKDRVDVAMYLADGASVVIEVEVEGAMQTMIGAHQALKYRALMAGERDNGKSTHAVLAAYDIPMSTKNFCKRHRIRTLELNPK